MLIPSERAAPSLTQCLGPQPCGGIGHDGDQMILAAHSLCRDHSERLETIPGIGVIGATAIAATLTDPSAFKSGAEVRSLDRTRIRVVARSGSAAASTMCRLG